MEFIFIILMLLIVGLICSLPLYLVVNLLLWVFHINFHLTLLQSYAIMICAYLMKKFFFKNKKGE